MHPAYKLQRMVKTQKCIQCCCSFDKGGGADIWSNRR